MDVLQIVQLIVLAPSLVFVGLQVLFQRQQAQNQILVQGQELYHRISTQYVALLRESDMTPVFNDVWLPLDAARRAELDAAQRESTWGAWFIMTPDEKLCYRYVRAAIELFEQMFQLHEKGWIDAETWRKWQGWISLAPQMRFYEFVLWDTRGRLVRSFAVELQRLMDSAAPAAGTRDAYPSGRDRRQ